MNTLGNGGERELARSRARKRRKRSIDTSICGAPSSGPGGDSAASHLGRTKKRLTIGKRKGGHGDAFIPIAKVVARFGAPSDLPPQIRFVLLLQPPSALPHPPAGCAHGLATRVSV
ncbi:uncharacterized protein [Physcomitrium patens]|uniref:uncharacterized protein isoform X2 n=1 Tax=Physcomitrium patens TaxID=3218 RepID=UPI003CCCC210